MHQTSTVAKKILYVRTNGFSLQCNPSHVAAHDADATHTLTEQGRRWPQQTGFHHLSPRVICFLRFAFRSISPSYTFIPTHQTKREVTWGEQPKPGYPSAVTTPSLGWGDGFCKTQLTDRRRGGMKKPTAKNASLRSMQRVCVCVLGDFSLPGGPRECILSLSHTHALHHFTFLSTQKHTPTRFSWRE